MKSITDLHRLRDFAEAYAAYHESTPKKPDEDAAIKLTELSIQLLDGGNGYIELEAFRTAQSMLLDGDLASEDRPMVERLRIQAALRFARKLALLPPTEKP